MQKTISRALLPILTAWLCILPARAYAVLPLLLAGARIVSVAAKTPAGQQLLINGPIGVGAAIGLISIVRSDGVNTREDVIYFPDTPRQPSAIEAAAGYTAGFPNVSPPAMSAPLTGFTAGAPCSAIFPTSADLVSCFNANAVGGRVDWSGISPYPDRTDVFYVDFTFNGTVYHGSTGSPYNGCAAGYTWNGASCVLFNPDMVPVPDDGVCPIVLEGLTFVGSRTDPDCANGQAPSSTQTANGGGLASVPSSNGDTVQVERAPDGSTIIRYSVANADTNTTGRRTITLAPAVDTHTAPVVSGVADSVIAGTGAAAAGGVPVTTTSDPATTAAIAANTAAIQALKSEIAADGSNSDVLPLAPADALKAHYDTNQDAAQIDAVMNGSPLPSLPGFLFPQFTAPACTPIGWTFQGKVVSYDICPHVPVIKSIAAWVLNLIAAAALFQMVMNFRAMRVRG